MEGHDAAEHRDFFGDELPQLISDNDELRTLYRSVGYDPSVHWKSKRIVRELESLIEQGADAERYTEPLKGLEELFQDDWNPQSLDDKRCVLEAIESLREDLRRGERPEELPWAIHHQGSQRWFPMNLDTEASQRHEKLGDVLSEIDYALRQLAPKPHHVQKKFDRLFGLYDYRNPALDAAREYLNTPWMHTPWLTRTLLRTLLQYELLPLRPPIQTFLQVALLVSVVPVAAVFLAFVLGAVSFDSFVYVLPALGILVLPLFVSVLRRRHRAAKLARAVIAEIEYGHYDGEELTRRLRVLEAKGVQVHSLIYSLLRLRPESVVDDVTARD